jgi:transposase
VSFVPSPPHTPLTVDALLRVIAERDAEVALLKHMVDKLKLQLARRVREQYGRSSEQLDAQLTLIAAVAPKACEASATQPPTTKPRKPRRDQRKLPEHLPRETRIHHPKGYAADAPCACSECGGKLRQIGEDVAEQLEYVPGRFKVIRHVRPKFACVRCEGIFQAMAPTRPIARGLPGPALLAHVMVAKYCDHLPLYRQSRIYARDGVDIDRSTMVGWVDQGDELIDPLAAALGRYTLDGAKVHADDTPVPVLDPGRGRTKTGRLWVYVRDDRPCGSQDAPAVWFQYSPDRGGEHPRAHLERYRGILQADAYSGYEKLYDSGRIVHAACMAHARRYYWDVYEAQKKMPGSRAAGSVAEQALERIAKLYEIEAEIRGRPPDERRRERLERAAPLLKDLHAWLSETLTRVSAKSDLAQAIGYTLAHWKALVRYCDDGRIEIDNNAAERALRGVGLGRKNYLFFGSDGGERAATSGLGDGRQQAIERTLAGVPGPSSAINRIDELLP